MTTRTALMVSLSKRPSLAPTSVVASVAAACEPESPAMTPISGQLKWNARPAMTPASALPPSTATVKTSAMRSVFGSIMTLGSSSTPTETRKIGMNSDEPMNCTRSMSTLRSGMARLRPRPAKNAPTMPSIDGRLGEDRAGEERRQREDVAIGAIGADAREEPARQLAAGRRCVHSAEHDQTDADLEALQAEARRPSSRCRRRRPGRGAPRCRSPRWRRRPCRRRGFRASPILRSIG